MAIGVVVVLAVAAALAAQSPAAAPTAFEVASVRRSAVTAGSMINSQPGGRFVAVNAPLASIITTAFGIRSFQLVDAPSWVHSERFDITALTGRDEYASLIDLRPHIQQLLADRFGLVVRHEQREMQTYALVRARPDGPLGPALRRSAFDCASPENQRKALAANRLACGTRFVAPGRLNGTAVPAALIANVLGSQLEAIVVNRTGLDGAFDFDLAFAPIVGIPTGVSADFTDLPSLFTAVQEQLGLRLERQRSPVDVVVVEHVTRPTEN